MTTTNPERDIPTHEIVLVRTPEERQQCYDVRIAVFHIEQKFPLETEIDENVHDADDKAAHFLLRLTPSLTPIGTIRAYKQSGVKEYYKLSRLAVLKDYRRYRFGRALVLALHEWVRQDALKLLQAGPDTRPTLDVEIVSHSQIPVKGFYAKFGYEPQGPEFDEDGDPHQKMVFRMPLRPSSSV
ncbi:acyl-CoA N-acyltransferase [Flammula alnicola]|nr:acyl-CoA N-acyltransferase [Flammula alnicola]